MSFLIGVDGGTESLRAFVFDLQGTPLGSAATAYQTRFPQPGWAEQDPEDWWRALGQSVRKAVAEAGLEGGDIAGLCLDTTCCSVVALGKDGTPQRPAMIWMDVRSAGQAAQVAETGDPALRVNGGGSGPVSAEWMVPKALWIKTNEPETYAAAAMVGEYQDYLMLRLTGRWTGSVNNMSVRWHCQKDHGWLPVSLLETLGMPDLAEKWPQEAIAPGAVAEGLTREAAEHLGLPAGLPVVQGGADAFIGIIGLGATAPGDMALITGSSHLQLAVTDKALHAPGIWGSYMGAVYPDSAVLEGGQTSTGSMVAWFKRHFAEQTSYDALNTAAEKLPPGAEGLLVLDHFQGSRTPQTDSLSRGAITGLTLKHTPAHIFRALIEGVGLGTRLIVETFESAFDVNRIVLCGGTTNSPFWLQTHADTLGKPIELTRVADAPALGCAILAAHGTGAFSTIEEGCRAMVHTERTIEPDPATAALYSEMLEPYRRLYDALKSVRDVAAND